MATRGTSPHVLDLSSRLASLSHDVSGNVASVRGTVGSVLQSADIVLRPEESPADTRIAAAEPKAGEPVVFQPFLAQYYGAEMHVAAPAQAARIKEIEKANEKTLRGRVDRLLRDYQGKPSPRVTALRYAALVGE